MLRSKDRILTTHVVSDGETGKVSCATYIFFACADASAMFAHTEYL
jgi:hypothetical protein